MAEALLDRARLRELFDLSAGGFALRGGDFAPDPYPTFHERRASGPVHEGTVHGHLGFTGETFFQGLPYPNRPHVSVYDFANCLAAFKDDTTYVTNPDPLPGDEPLADMMLFMDGARHRTYRGLVQPSFVPNRAVWWRERWIDSTIHALIDNLAGTGQADLNIDFCAPIPLLTITGSFGVSVEEALDIRAAVASGGQATEGLMRLLVPIVAARRAEPQDDLISVLVEAEMTDEDGTRHRLSDAEILGFAFLLLAAGSGTTWKQMGITLLGLLANPEAMAAAREDPAFLRPVVEESLRWMPTDPMFARFATSDTELGGHPIAAGSVVHLCLGAGNRDPERWERPDEFDPFRPALPHLGFGGGPHVCLGMHVARAEIVAGVGALLERLPNLRLDPDAPAPRVVGIYERGPTAVPVRFD